jgi:hypothetical protein
MLAYAKNEGHLPPPAIYDQRRGFEATWRDGALLSWRVAILPFLGEDERQLYRRFHLDEPAHSANNKGLIASMPAVYRIPTDRHEVSGASSLDSWGKTCVLAPVGDDCAFVGRGGRPLSDFTANPHTPLVVEVAPHLAVVWTEPRDLDIYRNVMQFDFDVDHDGFTTGFSDSSVQLVPSFKDAHAFFSIDGSATGARHPAMKR